MFPHLYHVFRMLSMCLSHRICLMRWCHLLSTSVALVSNHPLWFLNSTRARLLMQRHNTNLLVGTPVASQAWRDDASPSPSYSPLATKILAVIIRVVLFRTITPSAREIVNTAQPAVGALALRMTWPLAWKEAGAAVTTKGAKIAAIMEVEKLAPQVLAQDALMLAWIALIMAVDLLVQKSAK